MDQTQRHIQLAGFIKGVHAKLRTNLKQNGGDFDAAWLEHLSDDRLLSDYAEAMRTLANDYWEPNCNKRGDVTRIEWCIQVCNSFFHEGGLQCCLEKDDRRQQYHAQAATTHASEPCCSVAPTLVTATLMHCCGMKFSSAIDLDLHRVAVLQDTPEKPCFSLPLTDKIRVLDVGSCYNPLRCCEDLVTIGLDLCPAGEDVLHCDFLALEILPPQSVFLLDQTPGDRLSQLRIIKELFRYNGEPTEKCSVSGIPAHLFHAVVFSLLLEYFPETRRRWLCCVKAHRLLLVGGLLLVITPDSNHVGRRATQMKDWKKAIEAIGFSRYCYTKLEHVHCMAFRKTSTHPKCQSDDDSSRLSSLMHIPQDAAAAASTTMLSEQVEGSDVASQQAAESCDNFLCDLSSDVASQAAVSTGTLLSDFANFSP